MKNYFYTGIGTLLIAICVVAAPASAKKAIKNTAIVYVSQSTGGSGLVHFPIPTGEPGFYQLSYTANFHSQGTPDVPVIYLCTLGVNQIGISQSTSTSSDTSGISQGVNGLIAVQVNLGDQIEMVCGKGGGGSWTWGTVPLTFTALRIDDVTHVKIH